MCTREVITKVFIYGRCLHVFPKLGSTPTRVHHARRASVPSVQHPTWLLHERQSLVRDDYIIVLRVGSWAGEQGIIIRDNE